MLLQISVKPLVMKERMTVAPCVAFEVRSDGRTKGNLPLLKTSRQQDQDPRTASQRSALIRRLRIRTNPALISLFPHVTRRLYILPAPPATGIEFDFSRWGESLPERKRWQEEPCSKLSSLPIGFFSYRRSAPTPEVQRRC